jgi:hypothetical protein
LMTFDAVSLTGLTICWNYFMRRELRWQRYSECEVACSCIHRYYHWRFAC